MQGVNYDTVESDHVDDRSIFTTHAAQFFQTGQLDMADNDPGLSTIYRSVNSLFTFDNLFNYFAHDYRLWVPAAVEENPPAGSAAQAVADAYGSASNPDVMVNLDRVLNASSPVPFISVLVPTRIPFSHMPQDSYQDT